MQVSSIAISQPLDVIKTRIQNQNFESKVGGMTVIRELIKNEGFSAFFKGLTPKVLYVCTPLLTGPDSGDGSERRRYCFSASFSRPAADSLTL